MIVEVYRSFGWWIQTEWCLDHIVQLQLRITKDYTPSLPVLVGGACGSCTDAFFGIDPDLFLCVNLK